MSTASDRLTGRTGPTGGTARAAATGSSTACSATPSARPSSSRAQEAIRQIEKAAAEKAAEIERLEQAVAGIEGAEPQAAAPEPEPVPEPEPEAEPAAGQPEAQPEAGGFLVFVSTPNGYALREGEGEPPAAGNRLNVDGVDHAVAKLGRSPLPGDARRCAYLRPV